MTTKYEITYIIKPDVDDEAKKAIIDKYTKVIADNGGEMEIGRASCRERVLCSV